MKKNKVWLVTFYFKYSRLAHVHVQSDQFDLLLTLKPEMRNLSGSASQIMLAYSSCGFVEECDRRQRAMPERKLFCTALACPTGKGRHPEGE